MKHKIYSLTTQVISFILVILGFNACSGEIPTAYGTPTAKYKVNGKVVSEDASKKAIEGIQVVLIEDDEEGRYKPYLRGDTLLTDKEGNFHIERHDFPEDNFKVKFKDIDGAANGSFREKEIKITFTKKDYKKGSGSWFKGTATKDLGTVELAPNNEEEKGE